MERQEHLSKLSTPDGDPATKRKGQALLFIGMVACAASVMLRRFDLDFASGVCLGVALGLFFLGFRAFYRR